MKRLALILCFLLLTGQALGATYCVRQDGSAAKASATSCAAADTSMSPATFNALSAGAFSPDDIVKISSLGGTITTYLLWGNTDGTAGHPITIQSDDAGVVVSVTSGTGAIRVDGGDYLSIVGPMTLTNTGSNGKGLRLMNATNCTVSNVTGTGSTHGITLEGSSLNTISDSTGTNNTQNGIAIYGSAAVNSDNNTIDNCTVSGNSINGILVGDSAPSTTFEAANLHGNTVKNSTAYGNGSGIYSKIALHTVIHNNTSYNNTLSEGYGIAVQTSPYSEVYENVIYSNKSHGIENWGSHRASPTEYGASTNVKIYRNLVWGHHWGDDATSTGIKVRKDWIDDTAIWSNVVFDNDQGLGVGDNSTGVVWYNNTCYANNYGVYVSEATNDGTTGAGTTLKNNLISGNLTNALFTVDTKAALEAHTNNLYYQASGNAISYNGTTYTTAQVTNFEATGVSADPIFKSAATGDFSLMQGSPARWSGTNLGATYDTDYLGQSHSCEYNWSMGAIEACFSKAWAKFGYW